MSVHDATPQANEKEKNLHHQTKGSLSETGADSRKETERVVFSIDARANTADIVDAIPGSDIISESVVEDKRKKSEPGDSLAKSSQTSNQDEETELPELDELKIPKKKAMVRRVRIALQEEIAETKKEIKKYEKEATKKAFELSQAVDILRKLYGMLQEIAYKSTEFVKNIWISVMQGEKISNLIE